MLLNSKFNNRNLLLFLQQIMNLLTEHIQKINTFIFDVDGVFTDNSLIVSETDVSRVFNARDGYAVQMAAKAGFRLASITGGKQESLVRRLTGLGIKDVFYKVSTDKKLEVFDKYVADNNLSIESILYMGDDIPDLLLMQERNVLKVCPNDAVSEVLEIADFITTAKGGHEAVREIIELVMKTQGKWLSVF